MTYTPKKGDRVTWRGKPGEVVDDYWAHRDRFSVLFDGDREPLDFGAEALRLVERPCRYCGPGILTGLPGNACENCMNTGVEH